VPPADPSPPPLELPEREPSDKPAAEVHSYLELALESLREAEALLERDEILGRALRNELVVASQGADLLVGEAVASLRALLKP
jgi:hypothetical protein